MIKKIKALLDKERAAEYRRNVAERERSRCASDINQLFADYASGKVEKRNFEVYCETVKWCQENECGMPIYDPRYL